MANLAADTILVSVETMWVGLEYDKVPEGNVAWQLKVGRRWIYGWICDVSQFGAIVVVVVVAVVVVVVEVVGGGTSVRVSISRLAAPDLVAFWNTAASMVPKMIGNEVGAGVVRVQITHLPVRTDRRRSNVRIKRCRHRKTTFDANGTPVTSDDTN